jgi:site-specific recombinase XerD
MKLARAVREFVTLKRSLGLRLRSEGAILRSFCRTVGDVDIRDVRETVVRKLLWNRGAERRFRHDTYRILRRFYEFSIVRGYVDAIPLPTVVPKKTSTFVPHIYSPDEIGKILAATEILAGFRSPLRPLTYRTLLLLLYGTGLRISEALALVLSDVDIKERVLTIRETKFYKSRFVPVGPQLCEILSSFAERRRALALPRGERSAFFATVRGNVIYKGNAERLFRLIRTHAGVVRPGGSRVQPRLHDFRHTFAVRRLVAWYRQGADVQRWLPCLSTYLGHVNIASTQRYLKMTPELLREANARFERYGSAVAGHV